MLFSFPPFLSLFLIALGVSVAGADPLTLDVGNPPPPQTVDLGQGTTTDPKGHALTGDSQGLYLDGKPWAPIAGEFHFERYPKAEWRDELLKMKAGGLDTVSTYVFWIFNEETQGRFDWSDRRSLRDFLRLCREVGLKAIVRLGPYAHGEVRNGGFPDWVQNSDTKIHSADPAFLALVAPFYRQMAEQMKGLLWKDGGPVVAVQLDNEISNVPYLFALKKMARDDGIDVPYYTMTGWNGVALPKDGLLPLFGAYAAGFWGGRPDDYRKPFIFSPVRDGGDLGANMATKNLGHNNSSQIFPYLCCEDGAGMASSVTHRILIAPNDVAALALVKVGDGSNMPGYYMYQGGINPDGPTHFNEEHPNPMPVKDYDFLAPLGACGEVRDQYHLLREQHLFLQDFGAQLVPMPAYFPEKQPSSVEDVATVRWSVRSDGQAGFLFFNNYSRYDKLPDHPGVQFSIQTKNGPLLVPSEPFTLPADALGILPLNLNCDGVTLRYATAQPLARLKTANAAWYFFAALPGIDPDFNFASTSATFKAGSSDADRANGSGGGMRIHHLTPGASEAFSFAQADGASVHFVVLTPKQARELWRPNLGDGRDLLVLSKATVLGDGGKLRLQADDPANFATAVFPPPNGNAGKMDGVFARLTTSAPAAPSPIAVTATQENPGAPDPRANPLDAAAWTNAPSWTLSIPADAAHRHLLLGIEYVGNAARLYDGDRLLDDNLYKGLPFDVGLWRIPADHYANLRLKILPYTDGAAKALPAEVRDRVAALDPQARDTVTVTATEQLEETADVKP